MAGWYYYDPMLPYYDYGQYYRPPYYPFRVAEEEKKPANKKPADEKPKEPEKKLSKVIEMDVQLCCDDCVRKVQGSLSDMDGVESVNCDQPTKKVIVVGDAKPESVLKKVQKVRKDAKLVPKKSK